MWFNKQKTNGKKIDMWFYDDAAQNIYAVDLKFQKQKYKVLDLVFYQNVGGKSSAQKKFSSDILNFFNSN